MDKQFTKNFILPMMAVVFIVLIILYLVIPKFSPFYDSPLDVHRSQFTQVDYMNFANFLFIISFVLFTIASVLRAGEKFKAKELEGYKPEDFKLEAVEIYTLPELNYVIQKIEKIIDSDPENAWQWETKLKSVVFRRNKLSSNSEITDEELSPEQIKKLESESHLLKLNNYNLKARSDSPTVQSVKEKMALYKKHSQERV